MIFLGDTILFFFKLVVPLSVDFENIKNFKCILLSRDRLSLFLL